jgi:HupF/HypC family
MTAPRLAPPECHCITCGDEAARMRVLMPAGADGLVTCEDESGAAAIVDAALVAPLAAGDVVLVHAGVALVRLQDEAA